jgi:polysaccharide export outer membrane protein
LDKLRVTVFQVADLSGEFQVDAAGNIQFPLIGTVPAQGKTPIELKNDITRLLSARYLNQPDVQIAVLEQSEQTITVDGSVRQPGVVRGLLKTPIPLACSFFGRSTGSVWPLRLI